MKRFIISLYISFLFLTILACGDHVTLTDVTYVSSFEGGERYTAGAVTVLNLHGSHYQMGGWGGRGSSDRKQGIIIGKALRVNDHAAACFCERVS